MSWPPLALAKSGPLTLASGSAARAAILRSAGLAFDQVSSGVDEDALRDALRAEGAGVMEQAAALAEAKATRVSLSRPGIVLGADQMLNLEGVPFDKPPSMAHARRHLQALSGRSHTLETALVACVNGTAIWRHIAQPKLVMRPLSESFIDAYLERAGEGLLASVGAYQLEGLGAHLFERIEGDYFSILGLPLLPLLAWLRDRGDLPS